MKNIRNVLIGLFVFALASVQAQTTYEWDAYGIGFEVASDFSETSSDRSSWQLMSSDGEIFISVMPWSDASVTVEDLEEATYWAGIDLIFDEGAEVDGDCMEIDDFDGCFVVGAVYDEDWDYYLVALLLDTQSETNLQIMIAFNDGDEDEVVDMLTSFYAYD